MDDVTHSDPEVIWLTTEQLAARLGLTTWTLEAWRYENKGPKYRKLPGKGKRAGVRYKVSDVIEWESTLEVVDPVENDKKVQAAYERISKKA